LRNADWEKSKKIRNPKSEIRDNWADAFSAQSRQWRDFLATR